MNCGFSPWRDLRLHCLSVLAIIFLMALPIRALSGPQANLNGSWMGTIETAGFYGTMELDITGPESLRKAEMKLSNDPAQVFSLPLRDLLVSGNQISFWTQKEIVGIEYRLSFIGRLEGDNLEGTLSVTHDNLSVGKGTWNLKPSSALKAHGVELPAPSGPYAVGLQTFHWVDTSRSEVFTDDPNDRREVTVHVWYPAQPRAGATPAPYYSDFPDLKNVKTGLPVAQKTIAETLRNHSIRDAAISPAKTRFPILLFSPGGGSCDFFYTTILEEMASQGYVVASMSHTYQSYSVLLSDGRVVTGQVSPTNEYTKQRIEVDADDAVFVLSQMEKLNAAKLRSQFAGRLDPTRVGIFGHSQGGQVAPLACRIDRRFKACLNLDGRFWDGPFYRDLVNGNRDLTQPFMHFVSKLPEKTDAELVPLKMTRREWVQNLDRLRSRSNALFESVKSVSYRVTLLGADHVTFSDYYFLFTDLDLYRMAANRRSLRIVREYTLAFFNKYLKNRNSELLEGSSSSYPEVVVESFRSSLRR